MLSRPNVFEILVLIGGVHAEEKRIVGYLVDEDVVHESSVLIQQTGIMRLTLASAGEGVGSD